MKKTETELKEKSIQLLQMAKDMDLRVESAEIGVCEVTFFRSTREKWIKLLDVRKRASKRLWEAHFKTLAQIK